MINLNMFENFKICKNRSINNSVKLRYRTDTTSFQMKCSVCKHQTPIRHFAKFHWPSTWSIDIVHYVHLEAFREGKNASKICIEIFYNLVICMNHKKIKLVKTSKVLQVVLLDEPTLFGVLVRIHLQCSQDVPRQDQRWFLLRVFLLPLFKSEFFNSDKMNE